MIISEPKGWYRFEVLTQGHPHHPWLLFLHGFLGNRFEFQTVMATLSRDFFCVALDLPGHGQTIVSPAVPSVQAYSIEATAAGVLGCLAELQHPLGAVAQDQAAQDKLAQNKIGLLGYSMGGAVGLVFVVKISPTLSGRAAGIRVPWFSDPGRTIATVTPGSPTGQAIRAPGCSRVSAVSSAVV